VYAATVGGVRISEPAADLAVALAAVSAVHDRPIAADLVVAGELGLAGGVRPVGAVRHRLAAAARLGFRRALVPPGAGPAPEGMALLEVADLARAMHHMYDI
jgi:DNA repair protein RadA/Sms